jgi:hypothetical protein
MQSKVRGFGHGLAAHDSSKLRFGHNSLQGVATKQAAEEASVAANHVKVIRQLGVYGLWRGVH